MTTLEDAQVRVATAEEDANKLKLEILRKYESISYLDKTCQFANLAIKKDKEAVELRKAYHKAQKELRLAKSDLSRMRNEEQQKPAYMQAMDEAAEKAEEASVTLSVNGGPAVHMDSPEAKQELERSVKRSMQLDLEGKKAKAPLSGCIKIPPERFVLETPSWVLKGPKEVMLELVREGQRPAVKGRVQKGLRAKKDAIINDGDFDLAVERFTDEIMRGIIHRLPEDD